MKIESWLDRHLDSRIIHTNDPDEVHVCCPVCQETRYRLYINTSTGALYCHNCQFKGTIVNLIQFLEKIPYSQAKQQLADFDIIDYTPIDITHTIDYQAILSKFPEIPKRSVPLPEEYQRIDTCVNYTAVKARKYLHKRGITDKQIRIHNMGVCCTGEYANRVIIPIYSNSSLKFWVARDITGKSKLKEKSPHNEPFQFGKSEVLFNLDNAANTYGTIVLSEGIFDALSWGNIGVALLGKTLYNSQLESILHYKSQLENGIYVALDADAADNANEVAKTLSSFFNVYMVEIPKEYDDPNNYLITHSRPELWSLLAKSAKYTELSWLKAKLHNL